MTVQGAEGSGAGVLLTESLAQPQRDLGHGGRCWPVLGNVWLYQVWAAPVSLPIDWRAAWPGDRVCWAQRWNWAKKASGNDPSTQPRLSHLRKPALGLGAGWRQAREGVEQSLDGPLLRLQLGNLGLQGERVIVMLL